MKKTSPLEKHIGYWLRFVSNHVSQAFANGLASYDISVAEWVALNLLSEGSQSPATIAKMIGMTRGAISKVLEKLYNKQLIDRIESLTDRRYLEINLTDKGREILPKLMKVADENDDHFFGHLSTVEKNQVLKILNKIVSEKQLKDIPTN